MTETPLVDGDAPVPLREEWDLLPLAQQVTAGAVGEYDGVSVSVALVVDVDAIDRRVEMNRWAVLGITVLVFAATPFYLAMLATGWVWRHVAFNGNKVKLSYRSASPIR